MKKFTKRSIAEKIKTGVPVVVPEKKLLELFEADPVSLFTWLLSYNTVVAKYNDPLGFITLEKASENDARLAHARQILNAAKG